MENKRKHLEFIQNVITRMGGNSFLIKGWAISLITALFALAAKDSNEKFILVSYLVIPCFWILDGYFLYQERLFRELFKEVSLKEEEEIDFKMAPTNNNDCKNSWISSVLSITLIIYYGISLAVLLIIKKYI